MKKGCRLIKTNFKAKNNCDSQKISDPYHSYENEWPNTRSYFSFTYYLPLFILSSFLLFSYFLRV